MHIVQVFSSCERVIEFVNFQEEMFSMPTHGFLIFFFDTYSLNLKIFSTPPTFDSGPSCFTVNQLNFACDLISRILQFGKIRKIKMGK